MVFLVIPYGWTLEIGGLVYHFGPENTDFWEMCHPRGVKYTIFRDFL